MRRNQTKLSAAIIKGRLPLLVDRGWFVDLLKIEVNMQTSDMELIRDFLTEEEIFRKFQAWLEEKPREIESTEAESILCLLEDHIAAQKEFLNFHIK